MPLIKLTPELLRDGAQRLAKAKEDNDNAISKLDAIMNDLVSDWHGEAQDAFAASYARKRQTFQSFSVDIEALVEALKRFADTMEDQEKLQAGKAAGLN